MSAQSMVEKHQDPEVWLDFLRDYCRDEIGELVQRYPKEQRSLYVEARDVYLFDAPLLDKWLSKPDDCREAIEEALSMYDLPVDISLKHATVRLTDTHEHLDRRSVTDLDTSDIGDYVAVEGDLSRITGKKPRLDEGAYRCVQCQVLNRVPQDRTRVQEPHQCHSCERQGPFNRIDDESVWRDQRKVKLEEPIEERSQARGQSLPAYLEGDACDDAPGDTVLPDHAGERATVLGIVNVDESQLSGRNTDPETELWIDARAVVLDADGEHDVDIEAHRETFERLAQRDDVVEIITASMAPDLHAPEDSDLYTAKKGGGAWLFNGYRVDPDGQESKRGDFHMGFWGDPGTGKSTLMKFLHDVAPQSEFRSGTGLTEAGLTTAAKQEEFAGVTEWTLEPGILPRADGGHCLIDEIDAVVDEDTKAIHEALEGEQKIKTDKAGIKADLPTRTPLLVGGNPTHTRFDKYEAIPEQIDIDEALYDRLDLQFALQDPVDPDEDRDKAQHILNTWDDLMGVEYDDLDPDEADAVSAPVSKGVLRAWVAYARENVHPTLTPAVKETLEDFYVDIRTANKDLGGEDSDTVPATARSLESGVRVSAAFARMRLSDTIEPRDAEEAISLVKEVIGLNYDPETGELDADKHHKTGPTSQKDRRERLLDLVDEFETRNEPADEDAVVEGAVDRWGVSEDKIRNDLGALKQADRLYSPPAGGVRTT